MGRRATKKDDGRPVQIQVRVPPEFNDGIDELVERINAGKTLDKVTRTAVVKRALELGFDMLRKQTPSGREGQ